MIKIIAAEVVLSHILLYRHEIDMPLLRQIRGKLIKEFYLDVDSESVGTAVALHPELFAWKQEGIIQRANNSDELFNYAYIKASYGPRIPLDCQKLLIAHTPITISENENT